MLKLQWWVKYLGPSVQFSRSVVSDSLRPHELQHNRPPCPSPAPRDHSNSCPSSQWCHPAISSSVVPFSSCPQSLPASESFPMSQLLHMRWPKYWSFSFSIIPAKEIPANKIHSSHFGLKIRLKLVIFNKFTLRNSSIFHTILVPILKIKNTWY